MTADVAAIVPTHDRADLLTTTLRSVLWQRGVSLEVVVVDDGSSEAMDTVVERVGDPRVRVVRNETPEGVCAARNRGAAETDARWLAFCDDDDLWAPDKLARQVAAAEQQLTGALGRLIALSEAYPDLKANANFQQLQGELSDIENKIAAARRFFNNAVSEYNTGIQQLPAALFAGALGFHPKQFFDLGETRAQVEVAPSVKF